MNYQTFTNLQLKISFKNSVHSIKIELRDSTGEESFFVSVVITRVFFLVSQDFGLSFLIYFSYEMVAQSSA